MVGFDGKNCRLLWASLQVLILVIKKNSEIIIIQLNNKILDGSETLELCIMCDFNNAQVLYIEYTLYNGN